MSEHVRAKRDQYGEFRYVITLRTLQNGIGIAAVLGIVLIFVYSGTRSWFAEFSTRHDQRTCRTGCVHRTAMRFPLASPVAILTDSCTIGRADSPVERITKLPSTRQQPSTIRPRQDRSPRRSIQ